ncbi:cilia- and flagella-associated protein 418 isoform X1 [Mobula hypostoma]|uniref:cilia- and flagella-associated protein 418 isoform X1 n=1 Tax=Mobula hypostoma TaxID=723540 RepID=UPI002FC3AD7B
MADDLDELLDEVELRFCRGGSAAAGAGREGEERTGGSPGKEVKISSPSDETFQEEDDLNDLINDIFYDDPSISDLSMSSPGAVTNCVGQRAKVTKCSPVYLGGSSAPLGLGTNTSHRTCDQLRCTTCDFRVVILDNYEWSKSCDYLFFRNNIPDINKLKTKALRKRGVRAYACQCSWRSIQNLTDLKEEQQLRWVCGKH